MESQDSKLIADGRAWKVDGRAQVLVGPGLAAPLYTYQTVRSNQCHTGILHAATYMAMFLL